MLIANFIKRCMLSIIWFIFAFLFFYMAWREQKKSKEDIESLNEIKPAATGQVKILGVDFTEALKLFKSAINTSNKESHKIAATSYLLAGLTALISFIISLL